MRQLKPQKVELSKTLEDKIFMMYDAGTSVLQIAMAFNLTVEIVKDILGLNDGREGES